MRKVSEQELSYLSDGHTGRQSGWRQMLTFSVLESGMICPACLGLRELVLAWMLTQDSIHTLEGNMSF